MDVQDWKTCRTNSLARFSKSMVAVVGTLRKVYDYLFYFISLPILSISSSFSCNSALNASQFWVYDRDTVLRRGMGTSAESEARGDQLAKTPPLGL